MFECNILKKKWFEIFISILVLGEILLMGYMAFKYGELHLNSDNASELILANLLNEEGTIISKNWFYSTELRFLNTQLITAPLFSIFSDWTLLRAVSIMILLVILEITYIFFCKSVDFGRYALAVMPILFWPFSDTYLLIVLYGSYYVPHIAISFFVLGIFFRLLRKESKLLTILYIVLAVLSCVGGLRQLLILFIPLLITSMWIAYKRYFWTGKILDKSCIWSLIGVGCGIIGYVINKMLSKYYVFQDSSQFTTKMISIERIEAILNDILLVAGYNNESDIFSMKGITSVLLVVGLVGLIYILITTLCGKKEDIETVSDDVFFCTFTVMAFLVHIALFIFTTQGYTSRYWIPIFVYLIPIVGRGLFTKIKEKSKFNLFSSMIITICMFINGNFLYEQWKTWDFNLQQREVVDYLLDNEYYFGYATFWNGNIMTELSDGKIDINVVKDFYTFDTFEWLIRADIMNVDYNGKVFVLITNEELKTNNGRFVDEEYLLWENAGYAIYGYESQDELKGLIAN